MNRNHWIPITLAAVVAGASSSLAIEMRTYQFSTDNRPFRYQAWDPAVDAQLIGTFNLVLDQSAGTAQLANIQATILNPAHAPPNESIPLLNSTRTYFDNIPFSTRWPTNLSSLPGHFLAPDLLEFDGPNDGIFLKPGSGSDLPSLGHPSTILHYVNAYDTGLQLKLQGDIATITAVAHHLILIDSADYYLLSARATLVPEPSSCALVVITIGFMSGQIFRRRSTSHNRI
jgi:hypothetical protein